MACSPVLAEPITTRTVPCSGPMSSLGPEVVSGVFHCRVAANAVAHGGQLILSRHESVSAVAILCRGCDWLIDLCDVTDAGETQRL